MLKKLNIPILSLFSEYVYIFVTFIISLLNLELIFLLLCRERSIIGTYPRQHTVKNPCGKLIFMIMNLF